MKKILMALAATTMLVSFSAPTFAAFNPTNIYESSHTVNILNAIDEKIADGETAGIFSNFAWAYVNGKVYSLSLNELRKHGSNAGKFFSKHVGAEVRLDITQEQAEVKAAAKEAIVLIEAGVPADVAVRIVTERIEVPGPVRYVDREITVEVPGPEREVIREVVREVIRDVNTGRTTLDANLVADLNMIDDLTVTAVESTAPLQYGDAPTPNLGDYYTLTVGNDVVHYVYVEDDAAADPIWRAENDPGTNPLGALVAGDGTAAAKFAAENPAPVIGGGEITITGIDVTFTGDDEALAGLAPSKFTYTPFQAATPDRVEITPASSDYMPASLRSINDDDYFAYQIVSGCDDGTCTHETRYAVRDPNGRGNVAGWVTGVETEPTVGYRLADATGEGTASANARINELNGQLDTQMIPVAQVGTPEIRVVVPNTGTDAVAASLTVNGAAAYVTANGFIETAAVPAMAARDAQVGDYVTLTTTGVVNVGGTGNARVIYTDRGWVYQNNTENSDYQIGTNEVARTTYSESFSGLTHANVDALGDTYYAGLTQFHATEVVDGTRFLGGVDFNGGVPITIQHINAINDAINEAYSTGYEDGFKDGYVVGFADGVESVTSN